MPQDNTSNAVSAQAGPRVKDELSGSPSKAGKICDLRMVERRVLRGIMHSHPPSAVCDAEVHSRERPLARAWGGCRHCQEQPQGPRRRRQVNGSHSGFRQMIYKDNLGARRESIIGVWIDLF